MTHQTVTASFGAHAGVISLWVLLITLATLVPITRGVSASAEDEAFGPFTREAEMLNGRAAMVGMGTLLLVEGLGPDAFF